MSFPTLCLWEEDAGFPWTQPFVFSLNQGVRGPKIGARGLSCWFSHLLVLRVRTHCVFVSPNLPWLLHVRRGTSESAAHQVQDVEARGVQKGGTRELLYWEGEVRTQWPLEGISHPLVPVSFHL